MNNWFLISLGFIVDSIRKINFMAVGKYKTYKLKKNNPLIDHVGGGTTWNDIKSIHIGAGTYINEADFHTTEDSQIYIGDKCLISYEVVMRTDMHNHDSGIPIIEQGNSSNDIIIGNNVWIGHGVYIMPGVHIGDNSIIGAKAVVTKDIPPNSIAVGVPARVIKNRE